MAKEAPTTDPTGRTRNGRTRNGSIVTLFAVLLPAIIALIAFAVDYGIIVVARQELQNAADAAANAAVHTLRLKPGSADFAACQAITSNRLLGQPITFDIELDVEYGNWDQDSRQFTLSERDGQVSGPNDVSGRTIPNGANAVRVRLTRSLERGNAIQLFFAPVIGTDFAEIEVEAIAAGTPGCSGFVGIDFANLNNRATTDSYNSDNGDYEPDEGLYAPNLNRFENGDVCSNGPIDLASGARVNGDAAGSVVRIAQGSNASVSGSQGSNNTLDDYEPVNFDEANIHDNELIPDPPKYSYPPFFLSDEGDLIVSNGRNLTLESGVYRVRDLKVGGGSRLTIERNVTIYVERELLLDNGTDANPTRVPSDFQLFVGSGPVRIAGGNRLHGVIYAPEAAVTVDNNAKFFGSIIGKSLTTAGNAELHYDEALADESESTGTPRLVQ